MIGRNNIQYDGMVLNGAIHDLLIRNGIIYGNNQPEPPVGRTFTINRTTAPGDDQSIRVDGNDTNKPWYPLQPNDRFIIDGGSYDWIDFYNMSVDGGTIDVTCEATVNSEWGLYLGYNQKNVRYDFVGTDGYGLKTSLWEPAVYVDEFSTGGYENVSIHGIDITVPADHTQNPKLFMFGGDTINYDGNNPVLKNVTIGRIRVWGNGKLVTGVINIGDSLTSGTDRGYTENVIVEDVKLMDDMWVNAFISIRNTQGSIVRRCDLGTVNRNWTSSPPHVRLIVIEGQGIIDRCTANDYYGNIGTIHGYSRPNTVVKTSYVSNIKATNGKRYSPVEIHCATPVSGKSTGCHVHALGITADTVGTDGFGSAACVDCGDAAGGGTLAVGNSVIINGRNSSGGAATSAYQGGATVAFKNAAYANRAAAGTEAITCIPQPGSLLIGAGDVDERLTHDFYGVERPNPPSIGAVEPNPS